MSSQGSITRRQDGSGSRHACGAELGGRYPAMGGHGWVARHSHIKRPRDRRRHDV